eukprot:gene52620-70351_t
MKPSQVLNMHRQAIRQIVQAHNATNARVFGSVSQGLDDASSDLDILVDPTPQTSLFDIGAIRRELKQLLGVKPSPAHMKDPQRLADDVFLQAAFFRLYRLLRARTVVHAAWILDLAWDDNLAKSQIIAQA